jgi:serine/threonine protein kinase
MNSIPQIAPGGLCPDCLMQMALESCGTEVALPTASNAELDVTATRSGSAQLTNTTTLPAGTRIGSFQLGRRLGEGGMGAVYEAHDSETGRRVALKVLKHSLNTPAARKRFIREGRTAASVNHPNSVYVYGTDNIDGKLIISMELVAGGTLQDVVRQSGPLPHRKAVDAILQIIDGLEAAAKVGVLHRDVKPSNCFVDTDGKIKVGDFGLSVSTQGTEDSLITRENTVLGTPAFASPEQLRGDDLDVRSDIYSVGVTLFYLLTGEMPFKAQNIVQLLATVLEQPAPLAHSLHKGIPGELSNSIHRCLAKNPVDRWKNYAELRAALRPHSSEAPEPAPLPVRTLATVIDYLPQYALGFSYGLYMYSDMGDVFQHRWMTAFISIGFLLLYFTISESWKGATIGKAILGLRVVTTDRKQPSFGRCLARASVYTIFPQWITVGFGLVARPEWYPTLWGQLMSLSYFVLTAIMFSTARRRNGLAGLHDLISGTRVIKRTPSTIVRPIPKMIAEPRLKTNDAHMIGPYHVLRTLGNSGGRKTVLAYDMRLLRRVWIRESSSDMPELPAAQREATRPGRLRWLNGCRDGERAWDAFEAVEGRPLLNLIREPQSWDAVRGWLLDLATELAAAGRDGSLPETIGLRHVWITADGRAKLLDFVVPEIAPDCLASDEFSSGDPENLNRLLREVASASLSRDSNKSSFRPRPKVNPLPLHAIRFLDELERSTSLVEVGSKLQHLFTLATTVTRRRRWAMLSVALAFPVFMFAIGLVAKPMFEHLRSRSPEGFDLVQQLSIVEMYEKQGQFSGDRKRSFGIYIAAEYGDFVRDSERWNDEYLRAMLTSERRKRIEQCVEEYSHATPQEQETARQQYANVGQMEGEGPLSGNPLWAVLMASSNYILLIGLPCIFAAVLFRGGLLMLMFQVVCTTKKGKQAGRIRMVWRAILWILPAFGVLVGIALLLFSPAPNDDLYRWIGAGLAAVSISLPFLSILLFDRSLLDRLSGTYLVPR